MEHNFALIRSKIVTVVAKADTESQSIANQITEILGYFQFQDIVRQRLENATEALKDLDDHLNGLANCMKDPKWDGSLNPSLATRLDKQRDRYVMASERRAHDNVIGNKQVDADNRPAIELF
jgi:methyl-accepting chemotaxis protein